VNVHLKLAPLPAPAGRWRRFARAAALRIAVVSLLLALPGVVLCAASLGAEIDELLARPIARQAFWGVHVRDLDSGEVLYDHNGEKLFIPASNAKLFSTALGLARLGPDYQFTTTVVSTAAPTQDGIVGGDLVLVGGGDPNLSSRVIPYNPRKSFEKDPMIPLAELARQIVESGIRRVEGNLIGDDSRYVSQSYGDGWSWGDTNWGYGAPVGALCFNDNQIEILVQPGPAAGRPARLSLRPDFDYYRLDNYTRTAATRTVAQGLELEREPGRRGVRLWGEISIRSPGRTFSVAVDDPGLFAAFALRGELEKRGVTVTGEVLSRHAWPWEYNGLKRASFPRKPPEGQAVASIQSARLQEGLRVINKDSQNLHAEMLLREVGFVTRNVGSYEAGLEELESFLEEAGLPRRQFEFADASGLSRKDLVSPSGTVQLLAHMWNSPHRGDYLETLPMAGEDGTLDWRFARTSARGRIRAKTGTLGHVTALSGYASTEGGRNLAFSIYVNNFSVASSYIRSLVDRIVVAMIEARPEEALEVSSGPSSATGSAK
jgi:D-alanyl-D-alanine carboxypeptidase/D-alanyl-D-alanine-endopeptidase (penicillin-binding protein 4)